MPMKTIAERIYLGETATQIGITPAEWESRQRLVQEFVVMWPGDDDFSSAYRAWIATRAEGQRGRSAQTTVTAAPAGQRGLGDTVAAITQATGLDKLAHLYTRVTGKDCGCKRRQALLNKLVPYRR
ncbi:MAG: hypothetical protein SCI25_00280 [Desulfuromonadales bacterium]|nr:hypothetical protein [Desulfuromonadales bacterium]